MSYGSENVIKDLRGYLSAEEIKSWIENTPKFRDKVFLRLLWATGARVSEVVGDKSWKDPSRVFTPALAQDVDFKEGVIILNLLKRKKYPPPKRRVVLDGITLQYLREYILAQNIHPNNALFAFTRQRAFQIIRATAKQAGITRVGSKKPHPHHLRHSHCIAYIRKNNTLEGLRKLQRRIGHASINTTAGYLQFGAEQQKETEEIFGKW
jgi:integrase